MFLNIKRLSKKIRGELDWKTVCSDRECVARIPQVYRIKDLLDEPIQGTFYAEALQKVQAKKDFAIQKILKNVKEKDRCNIKLSLKVILLNLTKGSPLRIYLWYKTHV